MGMTSTTSRKRWGDFGTVVAMLAAITALHYLTPQIRLLPSPISSFLSRHAVERILFIVPVASATLAFGQVGGLVMLALTILAMLPRVLWLSPYPTDAALETAATAGVGFLAVWIIETQEREKNLHRRTVAQLTAVNDVSAIVTGSLELEEVLNGALDKVLEVTGLEVGLIFFLDEEPQELVLTAYRGVAAESAAAVDRLRLGEGFCGRVAQAGEPLMVEDSSRDPRLTRLAVQREGLQAQLIVPLKSKGEVQGVLAVATRRSRQFTPEEVQLIAAIGNQIGVAVENARLHRDVARQLDVQRRLNEVAEKITSQLELDRILSTVLQIAETLVGADVGVIALSDPASKTIRYPYLHNLPEELSKVEVAQGDGLAGKVIESGRSLVIEDYRKYRSAIPAFAQTGVTGAVGVPIVSGDQTFGMLAVGSLDEVKRFTDQDAVLLSGIGRQAGIAIENARLYENMRGYARQITRAQEDERKRVAQELHDETIQMLIVVSRRLEALASVRRKLPEPVMQSLNQLRELVGQAMIAIRRFIHDLRPPVLDHLGLMAALEGLVGNIEEKHGIEARLKVEGEVRRLSPEEELVLFRIAQEALNNVWRHSGASRVGVQLEFHPSLLRMVVEDNGCGFETPERVGDLISRQKLGLIGMHERAQLLGGELLIESEPGKGTRVTVEVPAQSPGQGT